jgi:methyl-accepting chemotaxis protein
MVSLKLKGQLLVPILGIIAVGIVTVQSFSYYRASNTLEDQITSSIILQSESSMRTINQWVNTMEANIKNWSRNEILIRALLDSDEAIEGVTQFSSSILEDFPWYEGIALVDKDGLVISASPASYATLDVSDRGYFKAAMNGEIGRSDPLVSRATGNPIFVVSAPIYKDNSREVNGVLFAVISITELYDMVLEPVRIGENGYAFITDPKGMIIGHPNKDYILELDVSGTDFGKEMISRKNGTYKYYFEDQKQWKVMAFLEIENADWLLALTAPLGELLAPLNMIRNTSIVGTILMILAVLSVVLVIVSRLINSIRRFSKIFYRMSEGELSVSLSDQDRARKDELGEMAMALEEMIPRISTVIRSVQESSGHVAIGSRQMSENSEDLSAGAAEQASSIEEVSASMEQMAANISQNTENALETEKIAIRAAEDAETGGKSVLQSVDAMKSIAEKITVIEEIARQTNLLALNAAIEAARAGEHGKGFAVVASEVRKLAEHSGEAATEIGELSHSSVMIAEKAGEMLSRIVPDIQKTASLVQEIASASREQNSGVEQINLSIQQLDGVIQQNASAAGEMASTAEELSGRSTEMQDSISFFTLGKKIGHILADEEK